MIEESNDALPIDYFADLEDDKEIGEISLSQLTELAERAKRLQVEIDEQTENLAEKQNKLNKIVQDQIPSAMEQLGIKNFTLRDGSSVKVEDVINASISIHNRSAAFSWLEKNNFDGIIKTKVLSEFGKGEIENARMALSALEKAGFSADIDRNIHPMTLKSFVKERLEAGDSIPLDIFGVHEFKRAKITLPRQPRKR